MTDIPIIFSAPMIRAFLDGRKTMTRRLAWALRAPPKCELEAAACQGLAGVVKKTVSSPWQRVKPGDRLWVRENFAINANQLSETFMDTRIVYAADDNGRALDNGTEKPWTPCIHMPRRLSRLTLIVEATKIEPLQAISEQDARAEGVKAYRAGWTAKEAAEAYLRGIEAAAETNEGTTAQRLFYLLWTSLHGVDSWRSNPDVVALTVRVIQANIDELSPPHKTHTAALAGSA